MKLDIVIPAYNEEERLGRTLLAYREGLPEADVRFFVALDRCTDDTASIVKAHAAQGPSTLYDIHHLERGYNKPLERFSELGLHITRNAGQATA